MKNKKFHLITCLLLAILVPFTGHARFATRNEAPIEYEFYNRDVNVSSEGQIEETIEEQIHILNEVGRENFSTQYLVYNGDSQKIEILEAKTYLNGEEYKVSKDMIETKPLASAISGFDQKYQILIAYPKAVVGAKLYLKYKLNILKQPLPNYFANSFYYGFGGYWKKSRVALKSALPFYTKFNDPYKVLDIKENHKDGEHTLNITLKKPIFTQLINEPSNSILEDQYKTFVEVSTVNSFIPIAKALAPNYEKVVSQPLTPLFQGILKKAEKSEDEVERINIVTSELSNKIRYMGDWKTINGQFFPRNLKDITASGLGDCKDFASSTAAILRKLGFKTNVALVEREVVYINPTIEVLPSHDKFNHAIVKVVGKSGKTYWIDPTNFTSMANGIYLDIAGRPTLVLDINKPSYETIPEVDYKHAVFRIDHTIELKGNNLVSHKGKVFLGGETALLLTGITLNTSQQAAEEIIFNKVSGKTNLLNKKLILPDLNSKIVKDIAIEYSYDKEYDTMFTNVGIGIPITHPWSSALMAISKDQVGGLFHEIPYTLHKHVIIKDVEALNVEDLNYEIKTPWFNSKRVCSKQGNDVIIDIYHEVIQRFIPSKGIKSKEYTDFEDIINKYYSSVIIVSQKKLKSRN